jgi:hypothetical protein
MGMGGMRKGRRIGGIKVRIERKFSKSRFLSELSLWYGRYFNVSGEPVRLCKDFT